MSGREPQCGWPLCACPPYDGTDRCPKLGGDRHRICTMEIGTAQWWFEKYGPYVEAQEVKSTADAMRRTVAEIRALPEAS